MEYAIISHFAAIAAGSVLISGAVVAACTALRRTSASFRHVVLVGMFVSLLALPVLSLLVPAWNLPVIPAVELIRTETPADMQQPAHTAAPPSGDIATGADPAETPGGAEDNRAGRTTNATGNPPSTASVTWAFAVRHLPSIALALWGIGTLIVLVIQLVRWAGAGFIAEMATAVENRELLSIAERIRWETGIKRRVGLLRSDMAAVSMAWGIKRPYVILPSCAELWPSDKVEAVLRHELAHVKRRDNLLQIIAVVACGLYWFNPFVWAAMKRLHFEREVACDNAVLNAGSIASAYAKHLMEISMNLSGPKSRRIIPAVMAHSSDIKKRLLSVLSPGVSRRPAGISAAAACIGLLLLLSLPVSAIRFAPRNAGASAGAIKTSGSLEDTSAGTGESESMKLTGDIHVIPAEEYRYLRGGKLNMNGSYTATGAGVFIKEAEIRDEKSNIRIDAKNVELDPGATLGCRFAGRGHMRITRREGRKEIEYTVRQRRKGGEQILETALSMDGRKADFDEGRRREFRDIAAELYSILDIGDDAAESDPEQTHTAVSIRSNGFRMKDGHIEVLSNRDTTGGNAGTAITIHNGRIHSDEGEIEVDGTIMTEGWSFRGSMDGTSPRVVIVDGMLRNEDAGTEIEGRNLVLDPEAERGFWFNEDEGYLRLTRYAHEAKIEYECRREKDGRKLVTTERRYLDGERVEPSEKGERELRRILESAYRWLTAGESFPLEPPAPSAPPAVDAPSAPPASPEMPALEAPSEYDTGAQREALRAQAREEARAAERRARHERARYEASNERFAEEMIAFIEEIGAEFETIESRYDNRPASKLAREAITREYEAREERLERAKDMVISGFRSNPETSVAINGCKEIIDGYEEMAISALESCGGSEERSELRDALVDFYNDLIDAIDDTIAEIEDGSLAETETGLFDAQMTVCREVREALAETRERIESFE